MRHVGASPPAGSAAGASSLCSSSQTRAAAAKATTHPRSESGKSMRREFEGVPYNTGDPVYSRAPGPVSFTRTSTLVALTQHSLWWRVGPSVARSLSRTHARSHAPARTHARPGGRMVAGLCRMMVAGIRIAFLLASEGAFLPQLPFSASGSS